MIPLMNKMIPLMEDPGGGGGGGVHGDPSGPMDYIFMLPMHAMYASHENFPVLLCCYLWKFKLTIIIQRY